MTAAKKILDERMVTAGEAIREGMVQALEADPRVFMMGEGATDPKGIFGTTTGLVERFGRRRVMEMPIAENGWTGVAIGAALMGQRPILVHQRLEFALLSMEQLVNNAAKMHYVSGGRHRCPIVVRLVVGRGWGQGPAHSQCLDSMFAAVPGLVVAMPSTPAEAKGMLLAAVRSDDPVVIIEHRWIHNTRGVVDPSPKATRLTGPTRLRVGGAATVVANSYMTLEALAAADALAAEGCAVDLFDLRVARPLQIEPILASVARTGRLVTVDTGHATFGLGAEITSRVCSEAFGHLVAPPVRIGLPDTPTPSSASLAAAYYPRASRLAREIGTLATLQPNVIDRVCETLDAARGDLPLDVPNPSFRGPF